MEGDSVLNEINVTVAVALHLLSKSDFSMLEQSRQKGLLGGRPVKLPVYGPELDEAARNSAAFSMAFPGDSACVPSGRTWEYRKATLSEATVDATYPGPV